MSWACVEDLGSLERREGRWVCTQCGRVYPALDGFPLLGRDAGMPARLTRDVELLDTLWASMQSRNAEQAAAELCASRRLSRAPFAADWKFLVPAAAGPFLELGPGFGDDSHELAREAGAVLIVPHVTGAKIVRRRLDEADIGDVAVALGDRLDRLPLPDASVGAVALDEASWDAFELTASRFGAVAAEWSRVLRPGGAVCLGLSGAIGRSRLLPRAARSRLRARAGGESFNHALRRAGTTRSTSRPGRREIVRCMRRQGFDAPREYAPLPDEHRTELVLPLDDPRAVRYFLNHLIPRNRPRVRAGIRLAHVALSLGLFRHLLPYSHLVFRKPAADRDRSD